MGEDEYSWDAKCPWHMLHRLEISARGPGAALLGTARWWRGIVPFTHLAREGAHDSHHRTARIAGRTRRRGGCVAARGARAARGQPPLIAYLTGVGAAVPNANYDIFVQGLRDLNVIEGRDFRPFQ